MFYSTPDPYRYRTNPPELVMYVPTCQCYTCGTWFELRDEQEDGRQYECPECEEATRLDAIEHAND